MERVNLSTQEFIEIENRYGAHNYKPLNLAPTPVAV